MKELSKHIGSIALSLFIVTFIIQFFVGNSLHLKSLVHCDFFFKNYHSIKGSDNILNAINTSSTWVCSKAQRSSFLMPFTWIFYLFPGVLLISAVLAKVWDKAQKDKEFYVQTALTGALVFALSAFLHDLLHLLTKFHFGFYALVALVGFLTTGLHLILLEKALKRNE